MNAHQGRMRERFWDVWWFLFVFVVVVVQAVTHPLQQRLVPKDQQLGTTIGTPPVLLKRKLRFPDDVVKTANTLANSFALTESHSWARALGERQFLDPNSLCVDYIPRRLVNERLGGFGCFVDVDLVGTVILETMTTPGSFNDDFDADEYSEDSPNLYPSYNMNAMHALVHECKSVFHTEFLRRQRGETCSRDTLMFNEDSLVAFFAWLATDHSVRGQGVGGQLVEMALTHIKKTEHTHGLVFAASPTSTRIFERAGFEKWGSVNYKSFEYGHRFPFASLNDGCDILVKSLY